MGTSSKGLSRETYHITSKGVTEFRNICGEELTRDILPMAGAYVLGVLCDAAFH